MQIISQTTLISFDRQIPIYNFPFPAQNRDVCEGSWCELVERSNASSQSRALYFHIPFCESLCNFCPFTKGLLRHPLEVETYVTALVTEIRQKAPLLKRGTAPIRAIFFGGGTPSILSTRQILFLGRVIAEEFDLSRLEEFSFEIEVKSLNQEKVESLRQIGVTHPRFGVQTFDPVWRDRFDLTATLRQVREASTMLKAAFERQSIDIIYGMNGQDEAVLLNDLASAVAVGTSNIDVYPIDNIVTQPSLHKKTIELGLTPTIASRKMSMRLLCDEYLRDAGFAPHNGHGYVRHKCSPSTVVSDVYSFVYHEHFYGYENFDVVGFGVNAITSISGHVLTNTTSRAKYIRGAREGRVPCLVSRHPRSLDAARPIILRLPYHGIVDSAKVDWQNVPAETVGKLDRAVDAGLVTRNRSSFELTRRGWHWYVNLMYFLMPEQEQKLLNGQILKRLQQGDRVITRPEIVLLHTEHQ